MSSPAQPILNWRDKLIDWSNKMAKYDTPLFPSRKKGPAPLAKDLGWADQTNMRKLTPDGPKLGQGKTTAKKKTTTKQTARKSE